MLKIYLHIGFLTIASTLGFAYCLYKKKKTHTKFEHIGYMIGMIIFFASMAINANNVASLMFG